MGISFIKVNALAHALVDFMLTLQMVFVELTVQAINSQLLTMLQLVLPAAP